jgi:hypothetical protein
VSATDSTLIVDLNLNVENRGSPIVEYELSLSTDSQTYNTITNYDGFSSQFELDLYKDSLEMGQIYRIRLRARNAIDWSDYSYELLAAMTAVPLIPSTPIRNELLSTKTSVAFSWTQTADNSGEMGAKITGYRVYMAKDYGKYVMVYDG